MSAVKRTRAYWFRLLRLFVVTLAAVLFGLPALLGVVTMWGLTHAPCYPGTNPGAFGMAYEDVRFPSARGITLDGYFVPGTNGATIIIVPAYTSGRGSELRYTQVFHEAGFNVLNFDSRLCSGHGRFSLGYQETEDVVAAFAYLETRADVDTARVGLHGFSSGGATALMIAPSLPLVRSVTAEGGYHDYAGEMGLGSTGNLLIEIYVQTMALTYRLITGDDIRRLRPVDAITELGDRKVLLVYGSREVTLSGARVMLERARARGVDADLWVVEGADHGDYLFVAPEEFRRRVIGFHRAALLGDAG